jgi:hypothetical protein
MTNVTDVLRIESAALQAEAQRLESVITQAQTDLRIVREKGEHINGLLSLYGATPGDRQPTETQHHGSVLMEGRSEFRADPVVIPAPASASSRRQTKATQLRDFITALLLLHGSMHRAEILKQLVGAGLMGHEKSPLPALAAFLSDNREVFEPDGRGNFMLRKKPNGDSPQASSHAGESGGVAPPVPA